MKTDIIPKGYKQTELGIIPEDWNADIWGNVLDCFSSGATPYRATTSYYKGSIRWITSGELNYNVIYETLEHISEEAKRKANLKIHSIGTFLMAITGLEAAGTRGSCGIVGKPSTTNQSCMAIYGTNKIAIPYLYHFYVKYGNYFAFKFCQGTKQQSYTAAIVRKLPVVFPQNKLEQQAIADALSDTDKLIESIKKLIEKKKAIKQGAMQQLLTGKTRLPQFANMGIWKEAKLTQLGDFTGCGVDKVKRDNEIQIKLLNFLDVFHNQFVTKPLLTYETTANDAQLMKYNILKGDVFFTPSSEMRTDIGISSVSLEDIEKACYSYHLIRFRFYQEWDLKFKSYIFKTKHFISQCETFCEGSGKRYVISLKKFRDMTIIVPPTIEEQNAIAEILSDMDSEIEALEKKLKKYQQIKLGMMDQLLTGKIRLVTPQVQSETATQNIVVTTPQTQTIGHNKKFDDAVTISCIVDRFDSETYPLGRKKVQKLLYLLRRKQGKDVSEFEKKAAGPYSADIRYNGGEAIANRNEYITVSKSDKGSIIKRGSQLAKAMEYAESWNLESDITWLVSEFRYTKVDDLETLATVDGAILDLKEQNHEINLQSIKDCIASIPEWKAKLSKPHFADHKILEAMAKLSTIFR